MEKKNNISSIKRSSSLIFGLAMAFLLFFQQPFLVENPNKSDNTEQSEQEKPDAEYRVMSYEVLLPVMQFNLFHSFDLILEIPNPDKQDFTLLEYVEKAFHNYFHTLFRLIISPNAP
jgi:hypothetical protein